MKSFLPCIYCYLKVERKYNFTQMILVTSSILTRNLYLIMFTSRKILSLDFYASKNIWCCNSKKLHSIEERLMLICIAVIALVHNFIQDTGAL